jgi:hypothetical protein
MSQATRPVFLTWPQILKIIADGCAGGRREAYETALRADRDAFKAKDWDAWRAACDAMRAAEETLIAHGCQAEPAQVTLF